MHPAIAAHAKCIRASCMGGSGSQCVLSPSVNASHDDIGPTLAPSIPPRTAKRPSLITHPLPPYRAVDMVCSPVQVHAASCAPCSGGPHTSADNPTAPTPPAQTIRPSGSRAAAGCACLRSSWGCCVHTPVARSTSCTVDSGTCEESLPPRRSTCPAALSLPSTAIAAAPWIPPLDSDGRLTNAAPFPEGSTSTLAVVVSTLPTSVRPPITATEPPTAQHACLVRAVTRAGIDSPLQRRQIQPPHVARRRRPRLTIHDDQPRQAPQVHLHPLSRRPAYPRQPPRPDGPGEQGDVCPDLGEGGGVLDVPAGMSVRGERRHDRVDVLVGVGDRRVTAVSE